MLIVGHLFFAANGIVSFSTCVDIGGSNAGTVAGIMNFFGQMGGFLLSVSFGKIADLANNFSVPVFVLAGCTTHRFFIMVPCGPEKASDPGRQ
jgi:nitrate/nitrite transporter NarK